MKQRTRRNRRARKTRRARGNPQPPAVATATTARASGEAIPLDDPTYRSFLVRLWHVAGTPDGAWSGEVEHIQSGVVVAVNSPEEVLRLMQQRLVTSPHQIGT